MTFLLWIQNYLMQHQIALTALAGWSFSAFMSSMPQVDMNKLRAEAGGFYKLWLYRFLQFVAANIGHMKEPVLPEQPVEEKTSTLVTL